MRENPGRERPRRVGELLKREIGEILHREINDPRLRLASVTRVKVSKDLSHAVVGVSVLGAEEERKEMMDGLKSASGFLRRRLWKTLKLKRIPELHFVADGSIEYAVHIAEILRGLEREREGE